ncbi:MAG TPA: hypothetical protein VJ729_03780 [Nitrososphaeraceae archaeon]|nr:hypothetical protein [Nitrososphaeraceae archaeon]
MNETGLALEGPLADKIANITEELQDGGAVLGQGFGLITDIQVGPDDGYLSFNLIAKASTARYLRWPELAGTILLSESVKSSRSLK